MPSFATTNQSPNLLHCSRADLAAALAALAQEDGEHKASGRRRDTRYRLRMPVPVYVALEQIDGSVSHYGVVPYSISNGGMGFLHGSFVHKDTRCALQLTALDGRTVAVSGVTTHATCLRGFVHFVGVKFDESINALDFVELDREDAEHYARNPKLCSKLAEDLNGLVVTNATISEMRAKYCELGQALFGQDASKRDKR